MPRLVLLAASVAAGLFLGEFLIRLIEPPFVIVAPAIKQPSATRGYSLIPGSRARGRISGEYDVTYAINSLGIRESEELPPESLPRVIVVGDSFTFGTGVEAEATFPKVLESRFREAEGPGTPAAFLNLGVYGYSSEQSRLLLEEIGDRYAPALVLYALVAAYDYPRNEEGIQPMPMAGLPGWARNGFSSSHLAQFLFKSGASLLSSSDWTAPAVLSRRAPELFSTGVRKTAESLRAMRDWASARGAGFAVIYMPLCYEVNLAEWKARGVEKHFDPELVGEGPTVPLQIAMEIAEKEGLTLLDLLEPLRQRHRPGLWFLKDRHLTVAGQQLVAEILEPPIRGLLAGRIEAHPDGSAGRPAEGSPPQ